MVVCTVAVDKWPVYLGGYLISWGTWDFQEQWLMMTMYACLAQPPLLKSRYLEWLARMCIGKVHWWFEKFSEFKFKLLNSSPIFPAVASSYGFEYGLLPCRKLCNEGIGVCYAYNGDVNCCYCYYWFPVEICVRSYWLHIHPRTSVHFFLSIYALVGTAG